MDTPRQVSCCLSAAHISEVIAAHVDCSRIRFVIFSYIIHHVFYYKSYSSLYICNTSVWLGLAVVIRTDDFMTSNSPVCGTISAEGRKLGDRKDSLSC